MRVIKKMMKTKMKNKNQRKINKSKPKKIKNKKNAWINIQMKKI